MAGLYCSWRGFASKPYTSFELGVYCSSMGALIGLTSVLVGCLHWPISYKEQNSLASRYSRLGPSGLVADLERWAKKR